MTENNLNSGPVMPSSHCFVIQPRCVQVLTPGPHPSLLITDSMQFCLVSLPLYSQLTLVFKPGHTRAIHVYQVSVNWGLVYKYSLYNLRFLNFLMLVSFPAEKRTTINSYHPTRNFEICELNLDF